VTIDPTLSCAAPGSTYSVCAQSATQTSPFAIPVIDGPSSGGSFNCLRPGEADPNNGLPSWGSVNFNPAFGGGATPCQLKVSSSVSGNTSDQTFIGLILPTPGAVVPESRYVVFLPLGGLVLLGGGYLALRRRNRHSAPAAAA
jgi:LPXTG-motif cell wall-anchored protein